jgi:hypothetical protein
VFCARNDEDRTWWLATTPFSVQPGGIGAGSGQWTVEDGAHLTELPRPARDLARGEPPMKLLPARVPDTLEIRGTSINLPAHMQAPRDPAAASNAVADMGFERRAWTQGLEGTQVFVFRERTLYEWHVTGDIPMGLDDLVRNMCRRGEPALAAVTVSRDVFPFEGEHLRAVKMVAEAEGVRFERILAMKWADGDGPEPSHLRYFASQPRQVGSDGWIGVEPITEVSLFQQVPEA